MKLSATHTFNCIVLMVKFGWTSCEDIPPALNMDREALFRRRREREMPEEKEVRFNISKERVLQASESCSMPQKSMNLVYVNGELLTALIPRLMLK